jgi:hypothetical protein
MDKKYNILIFIPNGYLFEEFYEPIINEFDGRYAIILALSNSYISQRVIQKSQQLCEQGKINEFHIVNIHTERSGYKRYLNGMKLIKELKFKKIDLVVWVDDFIEVSQYLLEYFKSNGALTVVIGSGLQYDTLYNDYRKIQGLGITSFEKRVISKLKQKIASKNWKDLLIGGTKTVFQAISLIKAKVKNQVSSFMNYRLIPFLLFGRMFIRNEYTKYNFAIGIADNVIVTDIVEYKIIKLLIPSIKNVHLVKHPAHGLCQTEEKKDQTKLLLVIGGPIEYKLPSVKMERWTSVVESINKLKQPSEIHLRFHPREGNSVKKQFEEAFRLKKISTTTINSNEYSIVERFNEYMGVVGSPSGALRFARAASSKIFVIGLVNATQPGFFSLPLGMGDTKGIHWLEAGNTLDEKSLTPPQLKNNPNPTVSNILVELLSESQKSFSQ